MLSPGGMRNHSDGYQTPAHVPASLLGYEPNPRAVSEGKYHLGSQQMSVKIQIPDSMIKVLPDWGYDAATREAFLTAFARMLRSINAVWLMHNERKEIVVTPVSASPLVRPMLGGGHNIFSPSRDRQTAAQARYGDGHVIGFGVATHPYESTRQAGVATGGQPPTGSLRAMHAHRFAQQPAASPAPTGDAASPSQATAPWRPLAPSAYPRQPTAYAVGDDRSESAQAGLDLSRFPASDTQRWQVPEVGSSPAPSTLDGQEAAGARESNGSSVTPTQDPSVPYESKAQGSSSFQHPAMPGDNPSSMDYHQRELEFMERRLEMEREARKHEMDSLKTMLQALTMQLNATQQANQIAFAKVHATTTYTHKGAEEWIVQERLRADFTEKFRYWHVEFNRWESPNETVLRARVYGYLVKKVPNELHRRVPENDVLGFAVDLVLLR